MPSYSWTQSLSEVVLSVPVPPGTRGRACDVAITRNRLRVGLKGQPPLLGAPGRGGGGGGGALWGRGLLCTLLGSCCTFATAPRLPAAPAASPAPPRAPLCTPSLALAAPCPADGPLFAAVKPDDSLWNLVDGRALELTLAKVDAMQWWRCVVRGEPEIDTQAVEPEASKLTDLGARAVAAAGSNGSGGSRGCWGAAGGVGAP